jgi:hypothetical protein
LRIHIFSDTLSEQQDTILFCAHGNQTLTTLSLKAISTSSILCSAMSVSLLATDSSTVFWTLNNCLSHLMVERFVGKLAYKNTSDTISGVQLAVSKF